MLAPNHFSQMDHFFTGLYLRRKIRFMAKSQIFGPPVLTYVFKHGGVFPVRRGHHDEEAFKTAFTLLDQEEMLLVYAEGGRSRSGELGEPKAGIGRIALESGAPVVPVAIHGSASVRRWKRFTFPKVTVQFGEPLTFPVETRPEPRAPARGRAGGLRPGAGDVRGPRRGASFTSTQRGLRKTRSPPLTFRPTWVGESRANEQHRQETAAVVASATAHGAARSPSLLIVVLGWVGRDVEGKLNPTSLDVPGTDANRANKMLEQYFGDSAPFAILLQGPPK